MNTLYKFDHVALSGMENLQKNSWNFLESDLEGK